MSDELHEYGFGLGAPITGCTRRGNERLRTWIRANFAKRRMINDRYSSYGLKHIYEAATGHYITNGAFIAAMVEAGYRYRRCGPNACFNVTTGSVRAAWRRCF